MQDKNNKPRLSIKVGKNGDVRDYLNIIKE